MKWDLALDLPLQGKQMRSEEALHQLYAIFDGPIALGLTLRWLLRNDCDALSGLSRLISSPMNATVTLIDPRVAM